MEFKIRPWNLSDLDSLVKHANNWNVAKNLADRFPFPYTENDGMAFIALASLDDPLHNFAIEVEGQAVGGIGIEPQTDIHRKNAELGYWLAEPFWGQGIISKAIKQVVDFAFATYSIDRVFARPFGINHASQRVLEKNHFVLEGRFDKVLYKNGEYVDELIYAIRRENWKK
jgi:RimJ/RimL family protein N-acetyltransferase